MVRFWAIDYNYRSQFVLQEIKYMHKPLVATCPRKFRHGSFGGAIELSENPGVYSGDWKSLTLSIVGIDLEDRVQMHTTQKRSRTAPFSPRRI